jgi:hypothetical protein
MFFAFPDVVSALAAAKVLRKSETRGLPDGKVLVFNDNLEFSQKNYPQRADTKKNVYICIR